MEKEQKKEFFLILEDQHTRQVEEINNEVKQSITQLLATKTDAKLAYLITLNEMIQSDKP